MNQDLLFKYLLFLVCLLLVYSLVDWSHPAIGGIILSLIGLIIALKDQERRR